MGSDREHELLHKRLSLRSSRGDPPSAPESEQDNQAGFFRKNSFEQHDPEILLISPEISYLLRRRKSSVNVGMSRPARSLAALSPGISNVFSFMAIPDISPDDSLSQLIQLSESLAEFLSRSPGGIDSLTEILLPFFSMLGWDRVSPVRIPRCPGVDSGWCFCEVVKEASCPPLPPRFRRALIAVPPPGPDTRGRAVKKDMIVRWAWNFNQPVCIFLAPGSFVLYDTSVIRWGKSPTTRTIEAWSQGDADEKALGFRNSISPVPLMWRIARANRTLPPDHDEASFTLQDALARRVRYWKDGADRLLRATDPGLIPEERRVRTVQIVFDLILAIMDQEIQESQHFLNAPEEGKIRSNLSHSIQGPEDKNLQRLCAHTFTGPELFLSSIPPEIYSRTFFVVLNENEHRHFKWKKRPFHEPESWEAPPDVVTGISAGLLSSALFEEYRGEYPVRILDPFCRTGRFLLELIELLPCMDQEERPGRKNAPPGQTSGSEVRLYGMDPDPVMLECTKFVIFLRQIVHGRNEAGKEPGLRSRFHREGDLPGISLIRGNAIIGPDILTDLFRAETGSDRVHRLSPFDWTAQFPWVNESGFDGVGGEFLFPPDKLPRTVKNYLERRYSSFRPDSGLEDCYIEQSLSVLREGGSYSVLLPGSWLSAAADADARTMISEKEIRTILKYGPEHSGTTARRGGEYCILQGKNAVPSEMTGVMNASLGRLPRPLVAAQSKIPVPSGRGGWSLIDPRLGELRTRILAHGVPLGRYLLGEVYRGTLPKGFRPAPLQHPPGLGPPAELKPYILGSSVRPYVRAVPDGYIPARGPETTPPSAGQQAPGIHGTPPLIPAQKSGPAGDLIIAVGDVSLHATLGSRPMSYDQGILHAPHPDHYLVGVINSSVARFYMEFEKGKMPERSGEPILSRTLGFPVHVIDTSSAEESRIGERIRLLVERMFLLTGVSGDLGEDTSDKLAIRIRHTIRAIDSLVCRLYGITPYQQKLMEGFLDAPGKARMAGDHHGLRTVHRN